MAAPEGIVWGSIVNGTSSGRKGRLGIYTKITNTNTETTVNVQVWFWTIYSCSDTSNKLYYNVGTDVTSATTSQGAVDIDHNHNSGSGWNTVNQTKILDKTYTYTRGTSATTYKVYAKLSSVDILNSAVNANTSYTVPALASYTVSYNANGGNGAPSSQTKWYGKTLTLSSIIPTRTGYSFQGWSTANDSSVEYSAGGSYTTNDGVTLYAVWKANTYSIKYNANGGSLGNVADQTKTYGVTLKLDSDKPTKTNYNFLGWATSKTGSVVYQPGGNYTTNAGATLYAVWELAYVKPRITNVSIDRCDGAGNVVEDGTYATAAFDWECDRANPTLLVEWSSDVAAGGSKSVNLAGTSGSIDVFIFGGSLSTEATYTVKITITDSVDHSTFVGTLSGTQFTMDFLAGGKGVAFGKPAELEGVFDVAFQTRLLGGLRYPELEPDTDLDSVKTPGFYAGENVTTYNYGNCPVVNGTFTLEVLSAGIQGQVLQRLTRCDKIKPVVFERYWYGGAWGHWFWAGSDEILLYENESGSDGIITMTLNNDGEQEISASHFRYLEIYFTDNNEKTGGYTKVWQPNGKTVGLQITEPSSAIYSRQTFYTISGQTLTPNVENASYYRITSAGEVTTSFGTNYIRIIRIVGRP